MFWNTDAMADAAKQAEAQFGPQGRYVVSADDRFMTIRLYTPQAGPFWYGDLEWPADRAKLNALAGSLRETVYVLPEPDFHDARSFTDQAIARIVP